MHASRRGLKESERGKDRKSLNACFVHCRPEQHGLMEEVESPMSTTFILHRGEPSWSQVNEAEEEMLLLSCW